MALPDMPLYIKLLDKFGLMDKEWLGWFRTMALWVSEPWKTNNDYTGTATLVAGTVDVVFQPLNANMYIFFTSISNTNAGFLSYLITIDPIPANNKFTITSSNGSDVRVINWELREPRTERT